MRRRDPDQPPPLARDFFTDRQDQQERLRQVLNAPATLPPPPPPPPVIHWYGVGGSGKSQLLRRLYSLMAEEFPEVPVALWDLETGAAPTEILCGIRTSFGAWSRERRGANMAFPQFDLAYSQYRYLASQGGPPEAQSNPLLQACHEWITSPLPGAAVIGSAMYRRLKEHYPELRRWLEERGQHELAHLRHLDAQELAQDLPRRLAADLKAVLPPRPGCARLAVVLLDTYERLFDGSEGRRTPVPAIWIGSFEMSW